MSGKAARTFINLENKPTGFYNDESIVICEFFLDIIEFRRGFFHGDILEIGVYEGLSASHFARHLRPSEKLFLNDIHDRLDGVANRVRTLSMTEGEIVPLCMFSRMISNEHIPDNSLRFIHIDGDHSRRSIRTDLNLADRTLRAEGIVVIDDFFSAEYSAVTYATFEWMAKNPGRLEMILVGFEKAYFCRPDFTPYYQSHFGRVLPDFLREGGIVDFTLVRGTFPSDFAAVGITRRRHDRDVITVEWDWTNPAGPEGRDLHL